MTPDGPAQSGVTYDVTGGVGRITLNRDAVSNAIDLPMAEALTAAVDAADCDAEVRAILITGAGQRFCAGGDLTAMFAATDRGRYVDELARTLDACLQRLGAVTKVVIAGVHGAVAGAGLAVMLSCDLVVAGSGTKFVAAYSGVGLTPDCGLSWLLPRAVGQQRALELLLTNRVIGTAEAVEWGLVTRAVEDNEVGERALAVAQGLADGAAEALGQTRRLVRSSWEASRTAIGADEARTIARAVEGVEASQLLAAFVGK